MLKSKLHLFRNYQKRGVVYTRRHKGLSIMAMDMGLGKTLASLEFAMGYKQILVVSPSSVKYQWASEILEWFGRQRISILEGIKNKKGFRSNSKIYIVNYKILSSWLPELKKINFDVIIIDECHYLKNPGSIQTKSVIKIAKNIPNKIGLSGTPMLGKPINLFTPCRIINTNIFPSYFNYGYRYCYKKDDHSSKGYCYNGAHKLEELGNILARDIMYRKRKEDVLKELPKEIKTVVPLKINMSKYNKAKEDIFSWLKEHDIQKETILAINKIEYMKQVVAEEKLPEIINWINTFLATGKKLVLFAIHKKIIDQIMAKYPSKCLKIYGSVPSKKRKDIIKTFEKSYQKKILIGNISAMGEGLNGIQLASCDVGFLEFPWDYDKIKQAYSRLHRLGQKSVVNIYFFMAKETIDMYILDMIIRKKEITDIVIDRRNVPSKISLKNLIKAL